MNDKPSHQINLAHAPPSDLQKKKKDHGERAGSGPDYNESARPDAARPCPAWAPPPCHYPGLEQRPTHAEDRQAIVYNSRRVCFIVVITLNANARARVGSRRRICDGDTPEFGH